MYHSIYINDKNTYDDYHLIPSSRPLIAPPVPKSNYVELPGGDGAIDLSQSLTKYVTYKNREGTWEFYVENGHNWVDIYEKLLEINGRSVTVILEDDPDYHYTGRVEIESWESANDGTWSTVTIKYVLQPYKIYKHTSLSDPELMEKYSLKRIERGTTRIDVTPDISVMPLLPVFYISQTTGSTANVKITFFNNWLNINNYKLEIEADYGFTTHSDPNIIFYRDPNNPNITSNMVYMTIETDTPIEVSIFFTLGRL